MITNGRYCFRVAGVPGREVSVDAVLRDGRIVDVKAYDRIEKRGAEYCDRRQPRREELERALAFLALERIDGDEAHVADEDNRTRGYPTVSITPAWQPTAHDKLALAAAIAPLLEAARRKGGRPRKHASTADRSKAARAARKAAGAKVVVSCTVPTEQRALLHDVADLLADPATAAAIAAFVASLRPA